MLIKKMKRKDSIIFILNDSGKEIKITQTIKAVSPSGEVKIAIDAPNCVTISDTANK